MYNIYPDIEGLFSDDKVDWKSIKEMIIKDLNFEQNYLELLDYEIGKVEKMSIKELFKTICEIFIRSGFDIGKIVRIFLENDLNWGFFADHNDLIFHNNAHPNNLIVLPDSLGRD